MATIAVAILIACEHPRQQVIVQAPTPTTNVVHVSTSTTSTTTRQVDWQKVGALASKVAWDKFADAVNKNAEAASETGRVSLPAPSGRTQHAVSASPSGAWDWDCVARAETGGNWSMHGGTYSSPFGVLNQAVRERAQPDPSRHHPDGTPYSAADVANAILSGTATREENIAMGNAEVARFGVRAWAPSTVAKCA